MLNKDILIKTILAILIIAGIALTVFFDNSKTNDLVSYIKSIDIDQMNMVITNSFVDEKYNKTLSKAEKEKVFKIILESLDEETSVDANGFSHVIKVSDGQQFVKIGVQSNHVLYYEGKRYIADVSVGEYLDSIVEESK